MTNRALYLLALALPLLVLGMQSAHLIWLRTSAPTYIVAVEGYDPRDLVYGEYLQFRFLWDDPRSKKPDQKDLPETGRIYLPEGHAWDLQTMLWQRKHQFDAHVSLQGKRPFVRNIVIDGKPWRETLDAWRQGPCDSNQNASGCKP